jgi:hypothetical protein
MYCVTAHTLDQTPVDRLNFISWEDVISADTKLIIILESYRGGSAEWFQTPGRLLLGYRTYTPAEHREFFETAGFVDVEIHEHLQKGWLAVSGSKPV